MEGGWIPQASFGTSFPKETPRDRCLVAYGHVEDAPADNISDMGRVPLPGAFGFKGATALTTTGPDPQGRAVDHERLRG